MRFMRSLRINLYANDKSSSFRTETKLILLCMELNEFFRFKKTGYR